MFPHIAAFVLGTCAIAGIGVAVQQGNIALSAGLGIIAAEIIMWGATRQHVRLHHALLDSLIAAALAASAAPDAGIWQTPLLWSDLFAITAPAAALAAILYFGLCAYSALSCGRHIRLTGGFSLLLVPYLFNGLLLLQSPGLLSDIGTWLSLGALLPPRVYQWLGSAAVLIFINEAIATLLFLSLAGRLLTDRRMHVLLLSSGLFAALTSLLADLGTHTALTHMPWGSGYIIALGTALLSQAGLWAQTFLVTDMIMDALRGKHPIWYWSSRHAAEGMIKGIIYSFVFFTLIYGTAGVLALHKVRSLLSTVPLLCGAGAGLLFYPFIKTIVESFDGSLPFFTRLRNNYERYDHWMRGAVVGAGVAMAIRDNLAADTPVIRFLFGGMVGALAYGAINILRDAVNIIVFDRRLRLQALKIYLFEALMGALAGGALAWYFDSMQTAALAAKFKQYATLLYTTAGIPVEAYVIYPLCSKWGALNLGTVTGGVRLFYCESLSGVVTWAIAAPLFSINLVLLRALMQGSLMPLKQLATRQGMISLVEQALRVQRWGLWMAPIIYSFLRISPVPTWYNQDGAVRTVIATLKYATSSQTEFHAWSLTTFTNMLAYDWLRIVIYLDHMCLRVATLVNFSFVGMDMLDEKIARLFGHSIRTRVIPQGLRRFVTWAPLLIPFYLPRGEEWLIAWNTAEQISRQHPAVLFSPGVIAGTFIAIAGCTGAVMLLRARKRHSILSQPVGEPAHYEIGNGLYTLHLASDGRSFSRVYSTVRHGSELDLTRRPYDELQRKGKFHYFQDADTPEQIWSLMREPCGKTGQEYAVHKLDRLSLEIRNAWKGIVAHAVVTVHPHLPLELWTLVLRNKSTEQKSFRAVSHREFALTSADAYLRHPEYHNLHIGTWFIPCVNALIASNRLLKQESRNPEHRRMSGEVAFHAVAETPGNTVLLTGYEDDRRFFIGRGTIRTPEGLMRKPRSLSDDGLLYTFDPAASLYSHVTLKPGEETTLVYADGYAATIDEALQMLRTHLRLPFASKQAVEVSLRKKRALHGFSEAEKDNGNAILSPYYTFSPDGTELHTSVATPRPWAHVIANEQGYGTVVNNHGEIFSFMGNSQQNGLTPFSLNDEPVEIPGQVVYVFNPGTGEILTPTFAPCRTAAASCSITYGRGYARFARITKAIDLSLMVAVLPQEPAEIRLLTVRNKTTTDAVFRIIPYLQIVLGETPQDTRGLVSAEYDEQHQVLWFTNRSNQFYRGWAFVAMSIPVESWTTSRSRFLGGQGRDFTRPYMVENGTPDRTVPEGNIAAAAFAGTLTVPAGGEQSLAAIIGQTPTREEALAIINRYRSPRAAAEALAAVRQWWADLLSVLRIQTSDPGFDRLVNDWLPYQVFTAHLWGRVGPNQRSGGYGYRDQLQAVLPLLFTHPAIARSQIVLHAAQQFYYSGDVLQWWHQSWEGASGLGARNRAADPHLWLPYLVYQYVATTGDASILDEEITFLERRRIPRDREGVMFVPRPSLEKATLYVHCIKALDLTLARLGAHGLPLIGTGDWNDGLNLVGHKGKGESVWLGFFLYDIIANFAPLIEAREGAQRKNYYLRQAARLRQALDALWRDGRYVRAITDNGREMTYADAINAAWPALSGAADFDRAADALVHGLRELEKEHIVLLLSPAFNEQSDPYPGKIADYPPGVRENGGQYSHGVSWFVDGLVRLARTAQEQGDHNRSCEFLSRAWEVWSKISPLNHASPHRLPRYGLPPHQQPADVYYGYGYEGRGGWSWYTGAAARMLFAAYQLLGITVQDGIVRIGGDLFEPKGSLQVHRLIYKGVTYQKDGSVLSNN